MFYIWWFVKEIDTKFWKIYNISIKTEDIVKITNSKGYVNLIMKKRKDKWEKWETHYIVQNEWNPTEKNRPKYEPEEWDLPF